MFAWFKVLGVRAVDMCGNTETDDLGIIRLPDIGEDSIPYREDFKGLFIVGNEYYLSITFVKVAMFQLEDISIKARP